MRYFFDLRLGDALVSDEEGTVCADARAACREARLIAADFVDRQSGAVSAKWREWEMDVHDEQGRCVLRRLLQAIIGAYAMTGGREPSADVSQGRSAGDIVILAVVRLERRHHQLKKQRCAALLRLSRLADRHRHCCTCLCSEIEISREIATAGQAMVERSRAQACIDPWGWRPH